MNKIILFGLLLVANSVAAKGLLDTTGSVSLSNFCKEIQCNFINSVFEPIKAGSSIGIKTYNYATKYDGMVLQVARGVPENKVYSAIIKYSGVSTLAKLNAINTKSIGNAFVASFAGNSKSYNIYSQCIAPALLSESPNGSQYDAITDRGGYADGVTYLGTQIKYGNRFLLCSAKFDVPAISISLMQGQ